ncbi:phenylalanine--tRNA ligase beta subunit-related protein [Paraclostridium bifermentans]|uniref:Phenylalanine--tRNA ligase beta subunit-related protein n=1 Tax=Paraclostridium bifermentans TaxID=1490 RepID=A0ABY8R689_PARBF|nr:phenylalanine--tRNA ligase beta subunit-related protein [Paraclostridium bifermentans]
MVSIKIDDILKNKCESVSIGSIEAIVEVEDGNEELWEEINLKCNEIRNSVNQGDIVSIKNISDSRQAYKKLGKDPSRYRLSSEALLKRIVKGNDLYKVNNIVDINNLVSLYSCYSVGSYDVSNIDECVAFTFGAPGEKYSGIGKGDVNLENLPVFEDSRGKFGSTTSDSTRAMITKDTNHIIMNIISFNGDEDLDMYINYASRLLKNYANADVLSTNIFK